MGTTALDRRGNYVLAGFVVLLAALSGLLYYKWGGAMRTIAGVQEAGRWTGTSQGLTTGGVLRASLFYFRRIWLALVYGLLIGAAVRAFVSPRRVVAMFAGGGPARRRLAGGVAGTPLMLCSCCITPVFTSVYERGAPLGSALSLMFASPGLNPAALLLTASLFPPQLAVARFAGALAAVFVLPPGLERAFPRTRLVPSRTPPPREDEPPGSATAFMGRFVRSLGVLSLTTLPLIVLGVVLSSLIMPFAVQLTSGGAVVAILLVALVAVVIALPTFFEIPLAMLLLSVGATGAATAMLVAGPLINLPSLFVLARETRPRFAVGVAVGVWLLAVCAGLAVHVLTG
jgi:uncharacterized membrane protein YraQ (UPF0718 family)